MISAVTETAIPPDLFALAKKANGRSNRAAVFVFKSQSVQTTARRIEMTASRIR
jgi:hypothetical protein